MTRYSFEIILGNILTQNFETKRRCEKVFDMIYVVYYDINKKYAQKRKRKKLVA